MVRDAVVEGALINLVNWAETLTRLAREGREPGQVHECLEKAGLLGEDPLLTLAPIRHEDAVFVAEIYLLTSKAGLSLGDRFCLATAARFAVPVLTADAAWGRLDLPGPAIRLIR